MVGLLFVFLHVAIDQIAKARHCSGEAYVSHSHGWIWGLHQQGGSYGQQGVYQQTAVAAEDPYQSATAAVSAGLNCCCGMESCVKLGLLCSV
jgi:hypothetical protein